MVCPDVVADRAGTLARWKEWHPDLKEWGWPVAIAVQDGMVPSDVPPEADVVFVGGSTRWKRNTLQTWCKEFPRVHVARVNSYAFLWICAEFGVESVDGTGWWHRNARQLYGLEKFCREWDEGHRVNPQEPLRLFT